MSSPESVCAATPAKTAVSIRTLARTPEVLGLYAQLRGEGPAWLLDSSAVLPTLGRFSFVGGDPYLVVRAFGGRVELERRREVRPDLPQDITCLHGNPFEIVRSLLPARPTEALPELPFAGGVVGYWGYELGTWTEPVALHGRDDLQLPDLALLFVDRLVAIDHVAGRCHAVGVGFGPDERSAGAAADLACEVVAAQARRAAERPPSGSGAHALQARQSACALLPPIDPPRCEVLDTPLPPDLECELDATAHAAAVREIKRDIRAGNVYQANLTQRMERPYDGDALDLYATLRRVNPAPFSAFIELPEIAVLSSSPERFVCLGRGGEVESRPIKGTRPRGRSAEEDERMAHELECSEKDRAENLMIVDLVRNDLGRVCQTGSVEVPQLMEIEAYASVFQMVSSVTGRLEAGRDVFDLLGATFPPGSMTGAPKIAAMEVIDRHESVRRGIYSGAIGYLDIGGGADLSVVIRTMLLRNGRAYLHAGGGIVADSEPAAEYEECLDKVRALLAAMAATSPPAEGVWPVTEEPAGAPSAAGE